MNFTDEEYSRLRAANRIHELEKRVEELLTENESMAKDIDERAKQKPEFFAEIEQLRDKILEVTQFWAVRWERLRELIHDNALHIEDEACNIMANETADTMEPPKYSQILNELRHVNESLRSRILGYDNQFLRIAKVTGKVASDSGTDFADATIAEFKRLKQIIEDTYLG